MSQTMPRGPSSQEVQHPKPCVIQPELKSQDQGRWLANFYLPLFEGVNIVYLKELGWVFSHTEPSSNPILQFTSLMTSCRAPNT